MEFEVREVVIFSAVYGDGVVEPPRSLGAATVLIKDGAL